MMMMTDILISHLRNASAPVAYTDQGEILASCRFSTPVSAPEQGTGITSGIGPRAQPTAPTLCS